MMPVIHSNDWFFLKIEQTRKIIVFSSVLLYARLTTFNYTRMSFAYLCHAHSCCLPESIRILSFCTVS